MMMSIYDVTKALANAHHCDGREGGNDAEMGGKCNV